MYPAAAAVGHGHPPISPRLVVERGVSGLGGKSNGNPTAEMARGDKKPPMSARLHSPLP
jgi:hypothetical protein